jgi:hypothetical protein
MEMEKSEMERDRGRETYTNSLERTAIFSSSVPKSGASSGIFFIATSHLWLSHVKFSQRNDRRVRNQAL